MVDLVLSPSEIAAELAEISRHPYVSDTGEADATPETRAVSASPISDDELQRIFAHLRSVSGTDFKQYKLPTILRRLQRRMALHKMTQVATYLLYLQERPSEIQLLYQDILIHVTRFFREADAFDALRKRVFPAIANSRHPEAAIRVWVCGCATGEEAYSLAIALVEFLGDQSGSVPIQIFGTDVSETAIEHARNGVYSESIAADISPERLRRFFVKTDGSYRISKMIRDVCVFARQDLTRDPPFSKLDLVLCRNVLIYMTAPLQRKLMALFHYALKPTGFLMLGHAETIGQHADFFRIEDKRNRIYAKKPDAQITAFPVDYSVPPTGRAKRHTPASANDSRTIQGEANRVILDRYAPAGVVVDADFQIVQFRGQTGPYLEPAPGDPSLSLLKMAREGLLYGLRSTLHGARKTNGTVRREGLRVRYDGSWRDVNIEVIPLTWAERSHFLVLFEEIARLHPGGDFGERAAVAKPSGRTRQRGSRKSDSRISHLQQELAASREYMQSVIQDLEAANEELQSANEEILSSNEELQSTNEELDTAKEELQSTNEELNTVNEELQGRNEELSRANSDLVNLLGSVEIAIVIVANDLRIRRFTPMAERVLNLLPADIGRPITHIQPNIDCPDLERLISEVVDRVVAQEREVRDRQGRWYSLRIRPYKNVDNRIDGAVLALFDVDGAKRHEQEIREARDYAEAVVETVREPLLLLDRALRVKMVNPAFCDAFRVRKDDIENQPLFELAGGAWESAGLRQALQAVSAGQQVDDFELRSTLPGVGERRLRIDARGIDAMAGDGAPAILLLVEDVTERTAGGA
jgi:two-component system CheB/CheR fusion protein